MLGFTPFGYDGVNQYPLEEPKTRAVGKDGHPVGKAGIGCWGFNLCPSQPESQRFMLAYVREMLDFYPNADGLMIESSDYAICHCPECGSKYFDKEFAFVRTSSEEVWAKRPNATVVQGAFATERTWCQPSPLTCPQRVRAMRDRGDLTPEKRTAYRNMLAQIREIDRRHHEPKSEGERELHRITKSVVDQWEGERELLTELRR